MLPGKDHLADLISRVADGDSAIGAEQLETGAHAADLWLSHEARAMFDVGSPEALGDQYFDALTEQLLVCVPEDALGRLLVDEYVLGLGHSALGQDYRA